MDRVNRKTITYGLLTSCIIYIIINIGGLYLYALSNFDHSYGLLLWMVNLGLASIILVNILALIALYRYPYDQKKPDIKKYQIINSVLTIITLILFGYTFYATWFANYFDLVWLKDFFRI